MRRALAIALLVLTLIAPAATAAALAEHTANYELAKLGIKAPYTDFIVGAEKVLKFSIDGLKVTKGVKGYVIIKFEGYTTFMSVPGYPMLPYKVYTIKVPGRAYGIRVAVRVLDYDTLKLAAKVQPASRPLPYLPKFEKSFKGEDFVEGPVYRAAAYFPGKLVDVLYGYGRDYTLIVVRLYPVQYNPATSEVVYVKNAEIGVYYEVATYQGSTANETIEYYIITTEELKPYAEQLARFYNETVGINATVVTVEWIWEHYEPINITGTILENLTGFYNPIDPNGTIYKILEKNYNYTLALKIIAYLNDTAAHPGMKYVLLFGDAKSVPPSFYYQSEIQYMYLDEWNSWVPTDYFYASPDLDLVPNYYVGRIPVTDNVTAAQIVNKIVSWYFSTKYLHPNTITLVGGYPFRRLYMIGEGAVTEIKNAIMGIAPVFNVELLTRTDETYTPDNVKNAIAQGYYRLWIFVLAHGSGTAWWDVKAFGLGLEWEKILDKSDLLNMSGAGVPVISSVACMNGFWDDAVIPVNSTTAPFVEGTPPSFGEAVLYSPGAGIAYIGSARVAWEIFGIEYVGGVQRTYVWGSTALHQLMLTVLAQAAAQGMNVTGLGDTYWGAVQLYYAYYYTQLSQIHPIFGEIAFLTIMEHVLLGDPALQLTLPTEPTVVDYITQIAPVDNETWVPAEFYYAYGDIPAFITSPAKFYIGAVTDTAKITLVKITSMFFTSRAYVFGHSIVATMYNARVNGTVDIPLDAEINGLLIMRVSTACSEYRVWFVVPIVVYEEAIRNGGLLTISLNGLYALRLYGFSDIEVYAGDQLLYSTSMVLRTNAYDLWKQYYPWWMYYSPLYGPWMATADHTFFVVVTNVPGGALPLTVVVKTGDGTVTAFTTTLKVYDYTPLEVEITAPTVYEPGETLTAAIYVKYQGAPVDADVKAVLVYPNGTAEELAVEKVGTGLYTVSKELKDAGAYLLKVEAVYKTETGVYTGAAAHVAIVVDRSGKVIGAVIKELKNVGDKIVAVVETKHGEVMASLDELKGKIVAVNDTVVEIKTVLGTVKGKVVSIEGKVATIATDLGTVKTTVDNIQKICEKTSDKLETVYYTAFGILALVVLTLIAVFAVGRKK